MYLILKALWGAESFPCRSALFQVEILEIPRRHQNRSAILGVLREAVTTWNPEAVILTHGYALS